MTCSQPSFPQCSTHKVLLCPGEESPALHSSCSAELDGKGFPTPNKPQADCQVSKPLAKGKTMLLLFQVLCDLALAKLLEPFSSHCTLAIH